MFLSWIIIHLFLILLFSLFLIKTVIDIIAAIITEAGALQCQVGVESVSGSFLKKKESMFKYINLSEINNKNVRSCQ